ncbi:MAG: MFS transporter [Dehalococcoidia bacterium]|nr:MAG: MFS transporter [Dehalococcoidia bacterium]
MAHLVRPPCDDAIIRAGAAARSVKGAETWVLIAAILGSSIAFIDGTVVNVALPALQADLGATVADVQWVVESYTLLLSALILVGGSLGDRYGRRRMFGAGIAIFAIASVACGLAPTPPTLIAARAAQGIGGALLVPGSLAIISAAFPESRRGRAIGLWSGFTGITMAIGPVLGGWLIEHLSWRWVFFLNLPIAAVVIAILLARVPETRDETATGRLDWAGALLVTIGLGGLVYGLITASVEGLTTVGVVVSLAGGAIALIAFLSVEARVEQPMLPLRLFRSRAFSGANLLTLLLYAALGGSLFFLPFNLIQVQGYSATAAGAAFLPFVLIMFVLSRWAGGLVDRYGARLPLIVGPAIAAIGFALFAIPEIGGSYWTTVFPAVAILGLGMGITVPPLTTVVMDSVDQRHVGTASGVNNAVARTAGLLAIALLSLAVVTVFNKELDRRLDTLPLDSTIRAAIDAQRSSLAAAAAPAGTPAAATLDRAIDEAYVAGYRVAMLIGAALAAISAIVAAVTLSGAPRTTTALQASGARR